MDRTDYKQLVTHAHDAFLAGDATALAECLSEDCVLHQCGFLHPIVGAAAIAKLGRRAEAGLSDRQRRIVSVIAEGDVVALRTTVSGRQTGVWFGQPASGTKVAFDMMTFVRVADGKIAEIWNIQDTATILTQLDAWPAARA